MGIRPFSSILVHNKISRLLARIFLQFNRHVNLSRVARSLRSIHGALLALISILEELGVSHLMRTDRVCCLSGSLGRDLLVLSGTSDHMVG